jgi:hypothetical protein
MQFSRSLSAPIVFLLTTCTTLFSQMSGSNPLANSIPFVTYTVTYTSTLVQTLIDGTTITVTSTVKEARGSKGQIYRETRQKLRVPADGQTIELINYSVSDPVAHTIIGWDNRRKILNITHLPMEATADALPPTVRVEETKREDLGVRTIAGFEAKGTRTTDIIPMGDVGNDRPLTIVTESWRSTLYHVSLLNISNDPRTGKRTDEVTEFQPGEPDPGLFQIPSGYTTREHSF